MSTAATVLPDESTLDFPIVGIGASAGGLRAIEDFFENMPADSGAAFVVVQHLSPDFKSLMNELLRRRTEMPVSVVTEGLVVEPNAIYLIPPGQNLELQGRSLHLTQQERGAGHSLNFPIDLLFQSLAREAKELAVSIVLSGTGSDGTRGIQHVSELGGIALAQTPETAEFDGMPQSAIATGMVDLVLSPVELAQSTYQFVTSPRHHQHNHMQALQKDSQARLSEGLIDPVHLRRIVRILERHENIDFTHYKPKTLTRRINRRCLIAGFTDIEGYIEQLESSAAERDTLRNELLITVTSFFRDTEAWNKLEHKILPKLIEQTDKRKGLRIWVTACATGEEAYSMGILIKELMDKADHKLEVKIFATDVDPIALAKAAAGTFPESISSSLSSERLSRFFTRVGDSFEVSRALREMIIFANHNLAKDAGFTQMDLVSCRNVLIYMQPDLQQQVLRTLHFSLKVNCVLFLGESENLGPLEDEFKLLDRKWKIYEKTRDVRLPLVNLGLAANSNENQRKMRSLYRKPEIPKFDPLLESAFQALLSENKATCFLVDRDSRLLHLCSDSLNLFSVSSGPASQDVVRMLPESIRLALNTALHRAHQTGITVRYSHCPLADKEGKSRSVSLQVSVCTSQSVGKFLMAMIEEEEQLIEAGLPEQFTADQDTSQYIAQLQQELQTTRENLQATIEELETTNEEQQATNEELIASNEELQSTNEELHSVNEELYTVNSEHQSKIQELVELNNDHDNLLNSINVGVIYLDTNHHIRKFTPATAIAFNLVKADIGRPLEHLSHNLEDFDIYGVVENAGKGQAPLEYSVKVKRGGPHLLIRVYPYLDENKDIQGSVITLVNVNDIQKAKAQLAEAETQLRTANETLEKKIEARTAELRDNQQLLQSITQATPNGIYIYDLQARQNLYVNNYLESLLGYSAEQLQDMGDTVVSQIFYPDDLPKIAAHHERIRQSQTADDRLDRTTIFDIEYQVRHASGEWRHFYSQDIIFDRSSSGQPTQILGTAIDVSDRKAAAIKLQQSEARYRRLYQNTPGMMYSIDLSGRIISASDDLVTKLGYPPSEVIDRPITDFLVIDSVSIGGCNEDENCDEDRDDTDKTTDPIEADMPDWLRPDGCHELSCQFVCKDGKHLDILLSTVGDSDETGQVTRLLTVLVDVTERKKAEHELSLYQGHLEEMVTARANELKVTNERLQTEVSERQQVQTELARRAQALERSNADLEQFAYVVSHDLQEPLRAMTVFSQLLEQRYRPQLEKSAHQYISNIVDGGIRMQALIDGILDFSRISHRGDHFQSADLNAVLETALGNLQAAQKSTDAIVTHDDLPTLAVDYNQITQLFQNLIGNAIKFRGEQPPSIHITAESLSEAWPEQTQTPNLSVSLSGWLFSIQDNGIGMETTQQDRIFALFQRLHTREEMEGYGIGLAICKKIVERHNGGIWVESVIGKGSTFYFTLDPNYIEDETL